MKNILVFSLILIIAFNFIINEQNPNFVAKQSYKQISEVKSCSNAEINTAYAAITACEVANISQTLECIKKRFAQKMNQNWNAFSQSSQTSDGIFVWFYNICAVQLKNYGKYNRTYVIWPSEQYNLTHSLNFQKQRSLRSAISVNQDCQSQQIEIVKASLNSCDNNEDNNEAARCITMNLRIQYEQHWDTYVQTGESAVAYWFFDDCSLIFSKYGQYKRNYIIWKAQPS